MNDSFGGAYMVYMFLGFVIIFIILISFILNYTSAFKVNNNIISMIEESETELSKVSIQEKIANYIENDTNYRVELDPSNIPEGMTCNQNGGYCYVEHEISENRVYYTIYTFVQWDFLFNGMSSFGTWTIKGETKVLGLGYTP